MGLFNEYNRYGGEPMHEIYIPYNYVCMQGMLQTTLYAVKTPLQAEENMKILPYRTCRVFWHTLPYASVLRKRNSRQSTISR